MKKFIILCLLFTFVNSVSATNWEEVMYKTYIDLSSWEYKNGYSVIWVKSLNQGDKKPINNEKVWYEIQKLGIDCVNRRIKMLSNTVYNLKGQVLDSYRFGNYEFIDIIPDSRGEDLYEYVCK